VHVNILAPLNTHADGVRRFFGDLMNFNCFVFSKIAMAGVVAAAALSGATSASAGTSWSVGVALPGVVVGVAEPGYYRPAPVYAAPPVTYYRPGPPVQYSPAPEYDAPRPVAYQPAYRPVDRQFHRDWDRDHHDRRDWERHEDRRDWNDRN
jgi:hypothetical protein